MITVVIPTFNAGVSLGATFAALEPARAQGLISDMIVVDGGSKDQTIEIAKEAGATVILSKKGRGQQLAKGGGQVKTKWILFLHGDTRPLPGWQKEVTAFMANAQQHGVGKQAAAFRLTFDEQTLSARFLERIVALRCLFFALPYGDQGLLISNAFYHQIGGFKSLPLMEDVDIVSRIGRNHLAIFDTAVQTSFARYRKDGTLSRLLRNTTCLLLYYMGVSPTRIAQFYDK